MNTGLGKPANSAAALPRRSPGADRCLTSVPKVPPQGDASGILTNIIVILKDRPKTTVADYLKHNSRRPIHSSPTLHAMPPPAPPAAARDSHVRDLRLYLKGDFFDRPGSP